MMYYRIKIFGDSKNAIDNVYVVTSEVPGEPKSHLLLRWKGFCLRELGTECPWGESHCSRWWWWYFTMIMMVNVFGGLRKVQQGMFALLWPIIASALKFPFLLPPSLRCCYVPTTQLSLCALSLFLSFRLECTHSHFSATLSKKTLWTSIYDYTLA